MTNIDEIIDRLNLLIDTGSEDDLDPVLNRVAAKTIIREFKQAVIAECGKDTERLDWLEQRTAFFQLFRKGEKVFVQLVGHTEPFQCETTRAVIDAAMESQ